MITKVKKMTKKLILRKGKRGRSLDVPPSKIKKMTQQKNRKTSSYGDLYNTNLIISEGFTALDVKNWIKNNFFKKIRVNSLKVEKTDKILSIDFQLKGMKGSRKDLVFSLFFEKADTHMTSFQKEIWGNVSLASFSEFIKEKVASFIIKRTYRLKLEKHILKAVSILMKEENPVVLGVMSSGKYDSFKGIDLHLNCIAENKRFFFSY
jgi:hypothetical protein